MMSPCAKEPSHLLHAHFPCSSARSPGGGVLIRGGRSPCSRERLAVPDLLYRCGVQRMQSRSRIKRLIDVWTLPVSGRVGRAHVHRRACKARSSGPTRERALGRSQRHSGDCVGVRRESVRRSSGFLNRQAQVATAPLVRPTLELVDYGASQSCCTVQPQGASAANAVR